MNNVINILTLRIALATSTGSEKLDEFAFGLTKEGLAVVSIALIVILVATFLAGRASARTTAVDKDEISSSCVPASSGIDDKQLVAVITAAIMAMRDEEARANGTEAGGFRVVSFRRSEHR